MRWNTTHRICAGIAVCLSIVASSDAHAQKGIPTPESVFGYSVGAEGRLFGYDQSIAYFKRLAAASKDVKLITVGTTSYGHPWTAVLISSQDNLKHIEKYRQINMRLAHPDGLTDGEARRLARDGKVFVDISGGLHASEIAGSQHTPQLAYDLLAHANDPAVKAILDNVVLFLWPSINPDGQDIVVDACRARDAGEARPPQLYQKYIGHDNNRDAYMMNVIESRVIQRTWREWEPDLIYVHHQAAPEPTRMWVPPFADPVGLHAPPIPAREINTIGTLIAQELDAHGQPGAVHMLATYDAWYPGYLDYMGVYQNIPSWWTETQGGSCASSKPATAPDLFPTEYRDLRPTPLYLSPWSGGAWTLRDAVNYMVTALMATLTYALKFKEDVLYNRYQSGRDVILKYRRSPPYAYIIPQAQHDPIAPVDLLRRMAFLGIRINQTTRDVMYDGAVYPKGTWVIPMDQEFAELVRELFEPQQYPVMGDDSPYDAAGWTLPYQMDVNVIEATVPLSSQFRAVLIPVQGTPVDWHSTSDAPFTTNAVAAGIVPASGGIEGTGERLLLDPAQTNSFSFMNRALAAGGTVWFQGAASGGTGSYLISGVAPATLATEARDLWVQGKGTTLAATPSAAVVPTRIALYRGSLDDIDEGWTEWLLDTRDFTYTILTPAELAAGDLSSRFDVIIFASQSLGKSGAPPTVNEPATNVDTFIRNGGTAVFWNEGAAAAIDVLHLPVKNVVEGLSRQEYFTGGSIMRVITDPTHPVMAGMPEEADVFVNGSPVFTTLNGFQGAVLAKYPIGGSPLRSGFLRGAQYMEGFAAALDVKHDRGHVVLIAFQPQWRGQSTGTFRVVFNSAFFGRDVAAQAKGAPGFWSAPPPYAPTAAPAQGAGTAVGGDEGRVGGRGGTTLPDPTAGRAP